MNIDYANQILDFLAALGALIFLTVGVGVSIRHKWQEAIFWVAMAIFMLVSRI